MDKLLIKKLIVFDVIGLVVGLVAMFFIYKLTNGYLVISLYFMLWANNLTIHSHTLKTLNEYEHKLNG